MSELERWMDEKPDTRLVIVDTLEKFRRPKRSSGYDYSEEYQAVSELQMFAAQRGVAVVLIDHTRKASAADVFDEIQGSRGKSASADTLAVFARPKQGGVQERVLHMRGRDTAEVQLELRFEGYHYELRGEATERMGGERQQAILELLGDFQYPLPRGTVVKALESAHGAGLDHTLGLMVKAGRIFKPAYGQFCSREVMERAERQQSIRRMMRTRREHKKASGAETALADPGRSL
jgi:hypothetical protein